MYLSHYRELKQDKKWYLLCIFLLIERIRKYCTRIDRYVLYKEKNMLSTEAHFARRNQAYMVQPERKRKVQKSMAAIKAVLGERKSEKIKAHNLLMTEKKEGEGKIATIEEIADIKENK